MPPHGATVSVNGFHGNHGQTVRARVLGPRKGAGKFGLQLMMAAMNLKTVQKTEVGIMKIVMRYVTMVDTVLVPIAVVGPLIMDYVVSILKTVAIPEV